MSGRKKRSSSKRRRVEREPAADATIRLHGIGWSASACLLVASGAASGRSPSPPPFKADASALAFHSGADFVIAANPSLLGISAVSSDSPPGVKKPAKKGKSAKSGKPASPSPTPASRRVDIRGIYGLYDEKTDTVHATGDVLLLYQGMKLQADEMDANLKTRDVSLAGHVVIQSADRTIRGKRLAINLKTKEWRLSGGEASLLPPRMVSPLYVFGDSISGGTAHIESGPGTFTTCDFPNPHYHIEGKRISIIPDKRAVIDGASFYLGSERLFTMRRLVLPLQKNRYNVAPEVGQNNIEGAYVKTAYHYPTKGGDVGTARLDLMSKRGVGVGVDQGYRLGSGGSGKIVLYSLLVGAASAGKEFTGSLRHNQKIGSVNATFQTDFRRNSYQFSPGTTTVTYNLGLTRGSVKDATAFSFSSSRNSGSYGTYDQQSYSLSQSDRWGPLSTQAQIRLFDSNSGTYQTQELDSQFDLKRTQRLYDLELNYARQDQLKSSSSYSVSSLERLPELTFTTDRNRFKSGLLQLLPGALSLTLGEYHEDPGNTQSMRVLLDMGLAPHIYKFGDSRLTINGDFKQMVYAGDAAQYIPNFSSEWAIPLSRVKKPTRPPFPGSKGGNAATRPASKTGSATTALSAPSTDESKPEETSPVSTADEATETSSAVPPDAMRSVASSTNLSSSIAPGFGQSPVGVTPFGSSSGSNSRSQQGSTHNQLSFRYLFMDPKGYTPFRFDMMGKYNTLTADYVHREGRFQTSVGGGKDFRGGEYSWNDLRLNARYTPVRNFLFGASTAYDVNGGQWRDLINEMDYRFGKGFLNLGTRYTPLTHKLGTLKWNLFSPLGRRYSLQTYGGWDGYANRYDYRVLRFNWELHDFRVSVSYVEENDYRSEKGIHLSVALRAFPISEETATGQYGQSLDTSVGSIY